MLMGLVATPDCVRRISDLEQRFCASPMAEPVRGGSGKMELPNHLDAITLQQIECNVDCYLVHSGTYLRDRVEYHPFTSGASFDAHAKPR